MSDAATEGAPPRRQLLVAGLVLAAVIVFLTLGYFVFLRTDYVVLAEGLRPADASVIAAELDKRGTPYRLGEGGATILVPEGQADATRVAIAGSDAAERGQIGFELFNKSDMGLTNFAQKINYQRALQGELVRTITMMDGVDSARVHLALPERTLFRGDRQEPTAAVTVAMKPGQTADPARVAGIQRLVAASVPDLPEGKVVVLDSSGRVISAQPAEVAAIDRSPAAEEKAAVESYYHAKAKGAVDRQLPGLRFLLRVLALPAGSADPAAPSAEWAPSGEGAARNFQLRLSFVTETTLGADDQMAVRDAVVPAIGLNSSLGDSLAFDVGPVDPVPVVQPAPVELRPAAVAVTDPAPATPAFGWPPAWAWGLAVLLLVAAIAWRVRVSGRARLNGDDHEAFAARLRRQLALAGEDADAVA